MCASYVSALAKVPTDALDAAGTKIVLIGCGAWDMIPTYQDTTKFKGLVYSDPTCKLHDTLSMVSDLVVPPKNERSIRSYVPRRYGKAVRKGIVEGLKQPINAVTGRYGPIPQLGGDFIMGPGNVCTYAHRMRNTMDHLEVHDLMALADVHLPPPPPPSHKHKPKQKRSQHSISYSARGIMSEVMDEDFGVCTLPTPSRDRPREQPPSEKEREKVPPFSSSASARSVGVTGGSGAGSGSHTPGRKRSPSTSHVRPNTTASAVANAGPTSPLEDRWNARPVSMILRGTGSESDLMYRAHHGLAVGNTTAAVGAGGPGIISGGYGYFDAGDFEDYLAAAKQKGKEKEMYADGEVVVERDPFWKVNEGQMEKNASGRSAKKRQPNPFSAVSIPVQAGPASSGALPSPTTSRPGTASGIPGGDKSGSSLSVKADLAGRPNTALGTRRPELRSLSTTSSMSSGIPVLKKSTGGSSTATLKKLKRSSTTTAVPTLITTTTPSTTTAALTIPTQQHTAPSTAPSSASTSPPFSPTTPTSSSSPPTSPLRSPPTKKRSLTTTQPPSSLITNHPPLSPSHSFALSFSNPPLPPSPVAAGSSPPTSSSPPRGAVNAKIINPAELLSADLESWSGTGGGTSSSSRPTTAGGGSGAGSIRSVGLGDERAASLGRRMRQMSL
ncbi:hypothetical protein FRB90_006134, partial [Tulasnella sp. 427]